MKKDFLFEIGTEELPPKALPTLAQAFHDQVVASLAAHKLNHAEVTLFYAPRRMALLIEQLDIEQPEQKIERKGPAVKAAYDAGGKPTKAMQGFLSTCKAKQSDIETLKTAKGEWVVYRARQKGEETKTLLPDICKKALQTLPIPKLMRWGAHQYEFVRPVHWLVMLLGTEIIPAELFGHQAGRTTYGHRFHYPQGITLNNPQEYETKLKTPGMVLANPDIRRDFIRQQVEKIAATVNGTVVMDETLLSEVGNIVEWPVPLLCKFSRDLLIVPQEALISSMQTHQKSFAMMDAQDKLMPYFITISNLKSKQPKAVIHGNEKVMAARLDDAKFFYEQDLKTPLNGYLENLNQVTFQKQLGSVGDKVQHIHKLSLYIAEKIQTNSEHVVQTALLCKCDLMTQMVMEFPELQGTMGKYYARHEGINNTIAEAIEDHYKPRFSGDSLARSDVGNAVSMADKIVTLVGIFGIGQKPTGTKDPYKLRRSAIGLLRIIIENQYQLNLWELLQFATQGFGKTLTAENVTIDVFDYVIERLRVWYQSQGVPFGVVDAVLTTDNYNLHDIANRINAVKLFVKLPQAQALAAANKRVRNILNKNTNGSQLPPINDALLSEQAEKSLLLAIADKIDQCEPMLQKGDYQNYLTTLATLREPVDIFFDQVMVIADDEAVKNNRLALLLSLRQLFCRVADVSKL